MTICKLKVKKILFKKVTNIFPKEKCFFKKTDLIVLKHYMLIIGHIKMFGPPYTITPVTRQGYILYILNIIFYLTQEQSF